MLNKRLITVLSLLMFMGGIVFSQNFRYIGAAKCKMCHNKPNKGEQYNKWSGLLHSHAYKSLSSQAAIDYGKANGIANSAEDPKCLKCHSTAASVDAKLHAGIKKEEGVSCESCHGPGSMYKSPAVMKNRRIALTKGLVIPDEELCLSCHNDEDPFFKGFDYETALKKIAHPDPTLH